MCIRGRSSAQSVEKNCAVIGAEAEPATQLAAIVARYETLRSAMLGEALPLEARDGLIVFLHQGMWGWTRMLAARTARPEPIPARSSTSAEPLERRAVIYVLAGMAMTINDRRTA
jgi:hypothetical protein